MATPDHLFEHSISNCYLSVYDSGQPDHFVPPNRLAKETYFPSYDREGHLVLDANESVVGDVDLGVALRMWPWTIGYDETEPRFRGNMWESAGAVPRTWQAVPAHTTFTTERAVFRCSNVGILPGLDSRRAQRRLAKSMVGQPFVAGQVRWSWFPHILIWDKSMFLYGADTSRNQRSREEFLVPLQLQIGVVDAERSIPIEILGGIAHAMTANMFDIDEGMENAASSVEEFLNAYPRAGLRLAKRLSPMLPDRRRYQMKVGESPSFKSFA